MDLDHYINQMKNTYFEFSTAQMFHNKVKLHSAFWNKQRPARNYDFPKQEIIEGENNLESIQVNSSLDHMDNQLIHVIKARRNYSLGDFYSEWTKSDLDQLLTGACGVTGEKKIYHRNGLGEEEQLTIQLRAYASGGALYPIEIMLYIKDVPEIEEGLYLYNPNKSALIKLADKQTKEELDQLLPMTTLKIDSLNDSLEHTKVILFLVANTKCSSIKYGLLAYKLALLEAGHIGQNIQLMSTALNKKTVALCGYYDDKAEKFLGIDGKHKTCVYVFVIG